MRSVPDPPRAVAVRPRAGHPPRGHLVIGMHRVAEGGTGRGPVSAAHTSGATYSLLSGLPASARRPAESATPQSALPRGETGMTPELLPGPARHRPHPVRPGRRRPYGCPVDPGRPPSTVGVRTGPPRQGRAGHAAVPGSRGLVLKDEPVDVSDFPPRAAGEGQVHAMYPGDLGQVGRYSDPGLPTAGTADRGTADRRVADRVYP